MLNIPEIPYAELEAVVLGAFGFAFLFLHLSRSLVRELRSRHCVFCGVKVRASDYEHHLELCGLKRLYRLEDPA